MAQDNRPSHESNKTDIQLNSKMLLYVTNPAFIIHADTILRCKSCATLEFDHDNHHSQDQIRVQLCQLKLEGLNPFQYHLQILQLQAGPHTVTISVAST